MNSRRFWKGLWRLADPRLTLASVSSMVLGNAAAAREGPLNWPWLLFALAGIVCLEIAKNASGEITDFDSGTDLAIGANDRSPFSGGRRVLVEGLLSRGQTRAISIAHYAAGIAIGLIIALIREPRILPIGLAGATLAWAYGGRPFRLAYHGCGEIAVAAAYGPLICLGAYMVQRHALSASVIWLSIPTGLLIGGFLWVNEFPDYLADLASGKRNLVVRLGRVRAGHGFVLILAAAFIFQLALPLFALPRGVWLGLAGLPFAWAAALRVEAAPENTPRIIGAQRWTLEAFVILAAATSCGLLCGR